MEGDGHDSVCEVEGFLDSVTMVNVYINVQHPRVVPVCECVSVCGREGGGGGGHDDLFVSSSLLAMLHSAWEGGREQRRKGEKDGTEGGRREGEGREKGGRQRQGITNFSNSRMAITISFT